MLWIRNEEVVVILDSNQLTRVEERLKVMEAIVDKRLAMLGAPGDKFEQRLSAIEARFDSLETLLRELIASSQPAAKQKQKEEEEEKQPKPEQAPVKKADEGGGTEEPEYDTDEEDHRDSSSGNDSLKVLANTSSCSPVNPPNSTLVDLHLRIALPPDNGEDWVLEEEEAVTLDTAYDNSDMDFDLWRLRRE
ncbi:hypothetical protein C0991_003262 [Blastosporella zonata]|nr:hypothetical protein C0991_003262 [Blastosporella zonata]